ncbi:MAG: flagellar type III secretion system pore protein FliP [Candidatus Sericytochromatia bacterium]|nr:flagellar type III secretion system pore protein FliP [Candidatus Sericytochromatia bacterium]
MNRVRVCLPMMGGPGCASRVDRAGSGWGFCGFGLCLLALLLGLMLPDPAWAQAASAGVPDARTLFNTIDLKAPLQSPGFSTPIQIMFLLGALTLLPFLFIATTPFIRIVVVLAFLKQATGLQNVPPGQVIIGMALFLSMYVMTPTWERVNQEAVLPYLNNRISQQQALEAGLKPIQAFMVKQVKQTDLAFFLRLAKLPDPRTPADVPFHVVAPAFMLSEVATAFKIGFIVYLPFIVVDLVITNVIMALGMQQLQTQMVAPPFKVMLFSLANGWQLLIEALVRSFRT